MQLGFTAIAFSADGQRLAVCTDEPELALTVHDWQRVRASDGSLHGRMARMAGPMPL